MKYLAINFFLLAFILILSGCETATITNDYVTVSKPGLSEEVINFMEKRGCRIEICDNGSYKIYNSAPTRDAALRLLNIFELQSKIVCNNLANANTTRTKSGEPYRRQFVKFNEDGTTSIENDMSDFVRAYKPGHPDADENGMVKMPNVNSIIEMVDAMEIMIQKEILTTALHKFDETFVW
jgi:flagellar basal-body rod protein FlgC